MIWQQEKNAEEIVFNIEYDRGNIKRGALYNVSWQPDLNGKTQKIGP